jgi:hypothetical protein
MSVLFSKGSDKDFTETDKVSGTESVVLHIGKMLIACGYKVYWCHPERTHSFIGKSGIHYITNEEDTDVIVDVRWARDTFRDGIKYVHWIHDPHVYNELKATDKLARYNTVIALTDVQKKLWDLDTDTKNFIVVNNPFLDEGVPKKAAFDPFKLVCLTLKSDMNKVLQIAGTLYQINNKYRLHVCACNLEASQFAGIPFVVNHGALKRRDLFEMVSDAFVCLYPTQFQENGPCICYECMYYGVPMLTEYVQGSGLNEIIPQYFVMNPGTEYKVYVNTILRWYKFGRPPISWVPRNQEIYDEWFSKVLGPDNL